jgi:hypothetical protein
MKDFSKNTAIAQGRAKLISTKQLPLFVDPPSLDVDLPPYPLQIKAIPDNQRVTPDKFCKLVHYESGLNIPGQFTYDEAKEILETTRYWDFSLDRDRIPRCVERLRSLLENICSRFLRGGEDNA